MDRSEEHELGERSLPSRTSEEVYELAQRLWKAWDGSSDMGDGTWMVVPATMLVRFYARAKQLVQDRDVDIWRRLAATCLRLGRENSSCPCCKHVEVSKGTGSTSFVFLVVFYGNRLAHSKSCLATVHRRGSSPRDVLDAAWASVGKPANYAEHVFHQADIPVCEPLLDLNEGVEYLRGKVTRIDVQTVGKIE